MDTVCYFMSFVLVETQNTGDNDFTFPQKGLHFCLCVKDLMLQTTFSIILVCKSLVHLKCKALCLDTSFVAAQMVMLCIEFQSRRNKYIHIKSITVQQVKEQIYSHNLTGRP